MVVDIIIFAVRNNSMKARFVAMNVYTHKRCQRQQQQQEGTAQQQQQAMMLMTLPQNVN